MDDRRGPAEGDPVTVHDSVDVGKLKGRHAGAARTWTFSQGSAPHTVYAREIEFGGSLQLRFNDPSKPGRDKRARRHLAMSVRKTPNSDVDPRLEKKVKDKLKEVNARLVAGLPPFGEAAPGEPREISAASGRAGLTLIKGFELALHEKTGKYASTTTRRYADMLVLRDILFTPGMLEPDLTWADLQHGHVVELWRNMADIHRDAPEKFGPRRAEVVIDALYTVASWLRKRQHIASNHAVPVRGWRTELGQEWEEKTNRPIKVNQPRHSVGEARAIFASLWKPERLRYRELLRVTVGGGQGALALATRQNIVRDPAGRPIALRLRVLRKRRNGSKTTVSVRVALDDRARTSLGPIDTEDAAPNAPLFDAPVHVLEIDPRIELAVELGAEMRLGQVGEARRSQLDLTRSELTPHGTFTVYGKKNKAGEKLALTDEQRLAVDHALETVLASAEASYIPGDAATDYHLLPSGKLVRGIADVGRARRAPITRDGLLKAFHALEVAAGVTPVEGRGWYGLRRIATDVVPEFTSDSRVQDKIGGWTAGSKTRENTYQNREDARLTAETARVRRLWRAGMSAGVKRVPSSSAELIAALPGPLRNAVLAHFGVVSPTDVGTGVGTNDNASSKQLEGGGVNR